MNEMVVIKNKDSRKIYYADIEIDGIKLNVHDKIIIENEEGYEYVEVFKVIKKPSSKVELCKVIRRANKIDEEHYEDNKKKAEKAYKICIEKIQVHKLKMKLIGVEYKFDNSKIVFYFTAEGRIDFRDLVKDLAAIFKTRIELRQIGIRDEVKHYGGNGICGRNLCCCSFLNDFETVSIKMAKEQNIVLNPSKITGNCGRLMCCLKYEQEVYEEKNKRLPKCGDIVKTQDGEGVICLVETLPERVKVKFGHGEDTIYKKYNLNDIKIIKNSHNESFNEEIEDIETLEELKKLEDNMY